MPAKSFYELDYIIELNEKRLDQYTLAHQKVLERLTTIILIYSALSIFLIPLVREIFMGEEKPWLLYCCFGAFSITFLVSIIYTIRLIIPVEVANLRMPRIYYIEYKQQYEQMIRDEDLIAALLSSSYINELELALQTNNNVFQRKRSFYYKALVCALFSVIPYLICLGFYIFNGTERAHHIKTADTETKYTLQKFIQ